ncbi:MAG: hypothetical protein CM1200mP41_21200 [Gammaproteobacteria bacterium]|nr:MAG: hypothetical protein CM1200mP41_21200 [Gammaproteobacteria bacterium]
MTIGSANLPPWLQSLRPETNLLNKHCAAGIHCAAIFGCIPIKAICQPYARQIDTNNSVTFSWLGLGPLILFSAHVNRRWPSSPSDQLLELSACCGGIMSILSGHKTTSSANKAFSFYLYFMRYFGNHRARHSIFLRCSHLPAGILSITVATVPLITFGLATALRREKGFFLLAINWSTSRYRFDQHASAS